MEHLQNWAPCPRPGLTPLEGAYARLEPLDWPVHGSHLYEGVASAENADLWAYMPLGPFVSYVDFQQSFEHARAAGNWQTMVILDAATGHVLGMATYMRIREAHGSAEVGCVAFGKKLQRSRIATDAMFLMACHVMEDLGYRRYEWKCNNTNEASKRAAVRFGFQFEGVFRNDMVIKGKNRDTAWYAMIDKDWPVIAAAFRAWLHPDNFTASGQQRCSLLDMRIAVSGREE